MGKRRFGNRSPNARRNTQAGYYRPVFCPHVGFLPTGVLWGEKPAVVLVGDSSNAVIPELSLEWELEHSVPSQRIRLMGKDLLRVDTHTRLRRADIEYDVTDHFRRTPEQGS